MGEGVSGGLGLRRVFHCGLARPLISWYDFSWRKNVVEVFENVKQTFKRMDERLSLMETQVKGLREDLQTVGGAFASIEAMRVAQAARESAQEERLAEYGRRLDALERRAS